MYLDIPVYDGAAAHDLVPGMGARRLFPSWWAPPNLNDQPRLTWFTKISKATPCASPMNHWTCYGCGVQVLRKSDVRPVVRKVWVDSVRLVVPQRVQIGRCEGPVEAVLCADPIAASRSEALRDQRLEPLLELGGLSQ